MIEIDNWNWERIYSISLNDNADDKENGPTMF